LETGTLLNVVKESSVISAFPSHPSPFPHGGIQQDVIKVKIGRMDAQKLLVFFIPLDLNRASMEDLRLIPGIGESLASEIVFYRERRKGFRTVDELKNVKGIGGKKWDDLKRFFTIPND
jgi:competence ComEA-like helix-hairpin-helix protein